MKKLAFLSLLTLAIVVVSCSDVKRKQSRVYMPDMAYSRAIETYTPTEHLTEQGINYTAQPVAGTIKRGGTVFPFNIPMDEIGDTTNYVASRAVVNPLPKLDTAQMLEAERLYLINCGICHGATLNGNGPLYNDGAGPYAAAPKNLIDDPLVGVMPEGQMFYSVTYGKGQMGSYSSQLSTEQRWMIIHYIKAKQEAAKAK